KKDFKYIEAYSLKEGTKVTTSADNIQISDMQNSRLGLTDLKVVSMPIGYVQVNSIVHISYQVTENPFIAGMANSRFGMSNSHLAKEEKIIYESELPLNFVEIDFDQFYEAKYEIKNGIHRLEVKPTEKAYALERNEVSVGQVYVTTAQTWEQVNKAVSGNFKSVWNQKLPKELDKIADGAKKLNSTKEKIEYVAKAISQLIAYSGDWQSLKGKFVPQDFAKIMKSKRGDCKDYSSLMVAVLRKLNYEAYPALTSRNMRYPGKEILTKLSKTPNTAVFNHAIVWMKDENNKELWLDPTNPLVLSDVISADILGNYALVLDGQSKDIKFLPEENAVKLDMQVVQSIKTTGNLSEAKGELILNQSSYNYIGTIEKLYGEEALKRLLAAWLNPYDKINISIAKDVVNKTVPSYKFSYVTNGLIKEIPGKLKAYRIPNMLFLSAAQLYPKNVNYFGEIGKISVKTILLHESTIDTFEADCLARSPWIDGDRVVTNENKNVVISDTVSVKRRTNTKEESQDESFEYYISNIYNCGSENKVTVLDNERETDAKYISMRKKLGPEIDKMTAADLDNLVKGNHDAGFESTGGKKALKFLNLSLANNPNNVKFLSIKAWRIFRNGYIKGEYYLKAYADDAFVYLEKAKAANQNKFDDLLFEKLVRVSSYSKRFTEAAAYLKVYAANSADKYNVAYLSANLAYLQHMYPLAEQWLKHAEKLATTKDQKEERLSLLSGVYGDLNRTKDQIATRTELLKLDPENAWSLHNLACAYLDDKNYDKVIEYEKKALAISEFGMARKVMSDAYFEKTNSIKLETEVKIPKATIVFESNNKDTDGLQAAIMQQLKKQLARMPANKGEIKSAKINNGDEYEADLLEALKWDNQNTRAFVRLCQYYLNSYTAKNDESSKIKLQHTLEQMIRSSPQNPTVIGMAQYAKKLIP
ncbi:MAG: transglutaminase domain-containing protein, partial [Pseudobdellovibrio sp.]